MIIRLYKSNCTRFFVTQRACCWNKYLGEAKAVVIMAWLFFPSSLLPLYSFWQCHIVFIIFVCICGVFLETWIYRRSNKLGKVFPSKFKEQLNLYKKDSFVFKRNRATRPSDLQRRCHLVEPYCHSTRSIDRGLLVSSFFKCALNFFYWQE